MIRDLLFRLRWWYRVKRGRCPLGPPPPCPEPEEFEIHATYTCVTLPDPNAVWHDNATRIALGLPVEPEDHP